MPQIKQIAGRAGRYGFNSEGTVAGEVTTLDELDMELLNKAMASTPTLLKQAALAPPADDLSRFATLLPAHTPLSTLLTVMTALSATSPQYFAAPYSGAKAIADAIQDISPLSIAERQLFSNSPANLRDEHVAQTLVQWVSAFAADTPVDITEWASTCGLAATLDTIAEARQAKARPDLRTSALDSTSSSLSIYTPLQLAQLESYHRALTLYLWYSFRMINIFSDFVQTAALRRQVEQAIDFTLSGMTFERRTSKPQPTPLDPRTVAAVGPLEGDDVLVI